MRTVQVKADICDDKYFNLFQIKGEVDKIYSLALENNMEREVIEEWRQLQIFVNVLLEGLKNKSHSEAIKELKLVFGGSRGLDDEHSKLARRILRQSGKWSFDTLGSCTSHEPDASNELYWFWATSNVFPSTRSNAGTNARPKCIQWTLL